MLQQSYFHLWTIPNEILQKQFFSYIGKIQSRWYCTHEHVPVPNVSLRLFHRINTQKACNDKAVGFFDLADNSVEEVPSIKNPKQQIHEEELNKTKNEQKLTSNLDQEVKLSFVISE